MARRPMMPPATPPAIAPTFGPSLSLSVLAGADDELGLADAVGMMVCVTMPPLIVTVRSRVVGSGSDGLLVGCGAGALLLYDIC
jgi:hypothetical protein